MSTPQPYLWFGGLKDPARAGVVEARRLRIIAPDTPPVAESPSTTERAHVDALRAGDADAFRAIYVEHSTALWEFTAYLLGDADAAGDVVQEVFAALWERRAALHIRHSLRAFLFRAVRNQVSKLRRHVAVVRHSEAAADHIECMGAPAPNPETVIDAAALEAAVDAVIQAMPAVRRTAATLRLRHGLTDAETAAVMGIGIVAVRMHVSRARQALRPLVERLQKE